MEQPQEDCKRCSNARSFNSQQQEKLAMFLICDNGHSLCRGCYDSYTRENRTCPFDDGKQILRVDIPIKALKMRDGPAIGNHAQEYIQLYEKNLQLKSKIERLKANPGIEVGGQIRTYRPNQPSPLNKQLQSLRKELDGWKDRTAHQSLVLFLLLDIPMAIIQWVATGFQIYILSWSIATDYQQLASIVFYLIILYVTTALIYYKQIFEIKPPSEVTCKSVLCEIAKLPIAILFYFSVTTDITRKRIDKYQNRRKQGFIYKDTLAFQKVNFCFFIGKTIIFIQQFVRLFDLTKSMLNQAVLLFSILEIIVFIGSDIISYYMMKHKRN